MDIHNKNKVRNSLYLDCEINIHCTELPTTTSLLTSAVIVSACSAPSTVVNTLYLYQTCFIFLLFENHEIGARVYITSTDL